MKLIVDNNEYQFFPSSNIDLNYNAIASSFSFRRLRNIDSLPLEFNDCQILDDNNEVLITGTILNIDYALTSKTQLDSVSGYSTPGILEDCQIPLSLYPLQSDNLSLKEIVDKLLQPFNIEYVANTNILTEFNKKFKKTNADPGQSVKDYINDLASQRGIILTHDNLGRLVFTKIEPNLLSPIVTFEEGNPGIFEMSFKTNAQAMHSEISVIKQASSDNPDAGETIINNPYISKFRPKVKTLSSGNIFDIEKAARNELGAELENIKLNIKTTQFVKPGNLIQFRSPTLKVNELTEFFVQSTRINSTTTGNKYDIVAVLKDVFTQDEVINIFEN